VEDQLDDAVGLQRRVGDQLLKREDDDPKCRMREEFHGLSGSGTTSLPPLLDRRTDVYSRLHCCHDVWRNQADHHRRAHRPRQAVLDLPEAAEDVVDVLFAVADADQQRLDLAFKAT